MTTCSRFSIGIAGLWEEEDAIGFGVEEANAELLLRVRGGCIPILHTIQNTIHKLNCGGLVRWGRRVAADFVAVMRLPFAAGIALVAVCCIFALW